MTCYAPGVISRRSAALFVVLAAGCGGGDPAPAASPCDADVERGVLVTTRGAPASVCAGSALAVHADVFACGVYRDATSEVVWSTDRPEVAVVHGDGTVVGTGPGTVRVTAQQDGAFDTLDVLVTDCGPDAGADVAPEADAATDATDDAG